jgi:Holliday junction resolvasome, endonuclease subunit
MKILALDLSLTCTGYSVLEVVNGSVTLLEKGHIPTKSKECMGSRLERITLILGEVLNRYDSSISEVVREASFSNGRIKATQSIFMVNGAITLDLYRYGYPTIHEVYNTTIKKTIGGTGKSTKEMVQQGLEKYVGEHVYKKEDESDSVAVGLTWLIQQKLIEQI